MNRPSNERGPQQRLMRILATRPELVKPPGSPGMRDGEEVAAKLQPSTFAYRALGLGLIDKYDAFALGCVRRYGPTTRAGAQARRAKRQRQRAARKRTRRAAA